MCTVWYQAMSITRHIFCLLVIFFCLCACGDNNPGYDPRFDDNAYQNESDCGIKDGNHGATVDYYNPDTGHEATYTLDVEVEDCHVVQINFPRGGWLDESHISPAEIDDGHASIVDDEGREFEIEIDQ
jgi:hypothetical protein